MRKWVRYKWKWALTCSKAPFDDTAAARRRAALKLRHRIRALEGRRYRGWHLRRIVRGLPKQVQRAILINHAVAYSAKSPFGDSSARWDSDSMAVGMDNRCSACISDKVEHFEDLRPCDRIIKGFGGTQTTNVMIGTLKWTVLDDDEQRHTWRIPNSYFVEHAKVRLLSPQHWSQTLRRQGNPGAYECSDDRSCVMVWGDKGQYRKTIPIDRSNNVFTFDLAPGFSRYMAYCATCETTFEEDTDDPTCFEDDLVMDATMVSDDELEDDEYDLSDDQTIPTYHREGETNGMDQPSGQDLRQTPQTFDLNKDNYNDVEPVRIEDDEEDKQPTNVSAEFLKYHLKFNHCSPRRIQAMAKRGDLPKRLATCDIPVCTACLYGKSTRRKWRNKASKNKKNVRSVTKPGQVVSVNMMQTNVPGLIAQSSGFLTKERYKVATVFVDHYSGFSYTHYQKSTDVKETLEAKEAFERLAASHGVTVLHYHADNGTFAARGFTDACYKKQQGITFAGVNAHHQNGRAEARIKHLTDQARTMLLHAAKRWPEAVNTHLWPYAIRMANDSLNATPWLQDKKLRTPLEMFSGSNVGVNPVHWHHFGCPAFVLDKNMQVGKRPKGGKWMGRAQMGIYLGQSPQHARSVALILNLQTGRVTPEFHVKMDSKFHSVKNLMRQDRVRVRWMEAAYFTGKELNTGKGQQAVPSKQQVPAQSNLPVSTKKRKKKRNQQVPASEGALAPIDPPVGEPQDEPPEAQDQQPEQPAPAPEPAAHDAANNNCAPRRSGRQRSAPVRLIEVMTAEIADQDIPFELFSMQAMFPEPTEPNDIIAMKASNDPDTMYYHQAMKQPDAKEFKEAMIKEVQDQLDADVLVLTKRTDIPKGKTILPAVWQMKRKRDIKTRKVKKWKARMNIDGSRMIKDRDYDLTYAPVASWGIIKLLLALTLTLNWHTVQLDFVLAFTQAPVERELYMDMPKGIEIEGINTADYCFKLEKNTYGQKKAGRVWNQYLVKKLEECGFEQSIIDECVFYKGSMIYVLYTDDSIIAGPDRNEINETIDLMKTKLELTVEGDLKDFLGVNIEKKDGGFWLTQPQLISQILEALRLKKDDTNIKATPMVWTKILGKEKESPEFNRDFNYRWVIGKLACCASMQQIFVSTKTSTCKRNPTHWPVPCGFS